MSFIRINGHTIPVMDGSVSADFLDIGERRRSFSGALLTDRRARKRVWKMRTAPLEESEAKAVEGLIAGLGDVYRPGWSDYRRRIADAVFWTAKGKTFAANPGSVRQGKAGDGNLVYDSAGITESKFIGTKAEPGNFIDGSFTNEPSGTNLLPQNVRDGTEDTTTTGFSVVAGASLASVAGTNQFPLKLSGLRCLDVTNAATLDGVATSSVAASAATDYIASVYVRPQGTSNIRVELFDDVGTIGGTTFSTLLSNRWYRLFFAGTTNGAATTIGMRVLVSGSGNDFYADQFQVEQSSANQPTSFMDNTRTESSGAQYTNWALGYKDMTVNCWLKAPTATFASTQTILRIQEGPSSPGPGPGLQNFVQITREGTTSIIEFDTQVEGSLNSLDDVSGDAFDGSWHMVTCVIRHDPEGSLNKKEIFVDGVSAATADPASVPEFIERPINEFDGTFEDVLTLIGSGSEQIQLQDVMLLPYAATQSLITSWFGLGVQMSPLPSVYVDGDVMPDPQLLTLCNGTVDKSGYLGATLTGAIGHRNNLRQVVFTLEEV